MDNRHRGDRRVVEAQSGFLEKLFANAGKDEDWEKYRLPLAAWLKYGRSSEMVIENIEDAITLTNNQQAKWQLSKFLKGAMKRMVENKHRSREELGDYLDYRNSLASGVSWNGR